MNDAAALSTGADGPYWSALLEGRLQLQRCAACKQWHWPAVWRCSHCGSWEQSWEDVSLRGKVYSWTRTWHAFAGIEHLAKPFVIAVVKLDGGGGARLVGIVDDNADVAIGDAVAGCVGETPYDGASIPALKWRRL